MSSLGRFKVDNLCHEFMTVSESRAGFVCRYDVGSFMSLGRWICFVFCMVGSTGRDLPQPQRCHSWSDVQKMMSDSVARSRECSKNPTVDLQHRLNL